MSSNETEVDEVDKLLTASPDEADKLPTPFPDEVVKETAEQVKLQDDQFYFHAYGRMELHESMLKDSVRTLAYRDTIYNNKDIFEGKIVLDVGCGTGILSLFAAEAGAAKVIAVEGSEIAEKAKQIVIDNQFEDVVVVIKGLIEEVALPEAIDKVDIILSEWMGHCLFTESMYQSVLYARDKWMAPGGRVLPNVANLYIAGISDYHPSHINFWDNVEGFDMSCIKQTVQHEAIIDWVTIQQLMTNECLVHSVNMYTVPNEPSNFSKNFELKVLRGGVVHAMILYFDVSFLVSETQPAVGFSTSPNAPWTHWEQTLLHLDEPLHVQADECVSGVFAMFPNERNGRYMDFELTISFNGAKCQVNSVKKFNNHQEPPIF